MEQTFKSHISVRILTTLLALTLLGGACLFGQERFGELSGVVTDSTGAVVPEATVRPLDRQISLFPRLMK